MACRLFRAKPLFKPKPSYCYLNHFQPILVQIQSNKKHLKCCLLPYALFGLNNVRCERSGKDRQQLLIYVMYDMAYKSIAYMIP